MKLLKTIPLLLLSASCFATNIPRTLIQCGNDAVCDGSTCYMSNGDYSYFEVQVRGIAGTYQIREVAIDEYEYKGKKYSQAHCSYRQYKGKSGVSFVTPKTLWVTEDDPTQWDKYKHDCTTPAPYLCSYRIKAAPDQ